MAAAGAHSEQLVLVVLLLLVIAFGALSRRLGVPYPIVLLVGGLAVSFVPGLPRPALDPGVIFLAVLPPLLYAAAWHTSWREFSRDLAEIASLAVGVVALTVAGVALTAGWILPGLDGRAGFVLGAVVATTDAIAATSIARRMGLPRRTVALLEGESLVNDATGLLALELGIALLVRGAAPSVGYALLRLGFLVVAGIGVGLLLGWVVDWVERRIDDGPIEIAISILVPYGAYLVADAIHASGVLAVVTAGLYLSRRSARFFSPEVRIQAYAVWDALTFILNGMVFVLLGLQLPVVLAGIRDLGPGRLVPAGAALGAVVIGLRLLGVIPAAGLAAWIRRHVLRQEAAMPPPRQLFVLGWAGMRGVVALAAAMALPVATAGGAPFRQRNAIVFLTFCVIVATLLLQGLALPPLVRALGLEGSAGPDCEEPEARRIVLEAALARLDELRASGRDGPVLEAIYDDVGEHYRHRLAALSRAHPAGRGADRPPPRGRRREVLRELLRAEREAVIRLRDERRISDEVLRRIEREIDLSDARLPPLAR
ncbi:Na+/H+ antiporter [Anaeromyxobacter oryzisoli]|uniref:Na+/H+ antiporter n=1 Tax=Anaeromyxobacter oryzisoli TaxID=2925408 RepID=UPI001F5AE313|nr:Na+/H+ antiporter [Anaeromyxobacter sp. SG63]